MPGDTPGRERPNPVDPLYPPNATDDALTRLPGESPCVFEPGADGWTTCDVHGWSGPSSQRSRVLVCPDSATPAPPPDALRAAASAALATFDEPGGMFTLRDRMDALRAALAATPGDAPSVTPADVLRGLRAEVEGIGNHFSHDVLWFAGWETMRDNVLRAIDASLAAQPEPSATHDCGCRICTNGRECGWCKRGMHHRAYEEAPR